MHNLKPSLLFAVCAWSLLILRFGYQYGTNDQVELLPYTLYLHDHSLYAKDFFIQGIDATRPNERTVLAYLLLPFVNHLEIACFILQFFSTVILVLGLEKLAGKFIRNKYLAWAAVLISLIPLNDYAVGNVEIYSACAQASSIATAMVVWALNLFLERRFSRASALLALASIIQVLEGLDVMLLLSAVILVMFVSKEITRRTFFTFFSIYAFTAGIYLLFVYHAKGAGSVANCQPVSNQTLFQILFRFRHPHNFIFTSFPKFKLLVFFLLSVFGLVFYSRHSQKTFEILLLGLFGIILYAFATDDFHNIFIANFGFYRVTPWMKFLGVVAVVGLFEAYYFNVNLPLFRFEKAASFGLIIVCWVVILGFNTYLPYKVPFQIFGLKEKDDMIAICEQIRLHTPPDALFIQPFDNTELKYYGQRSSFVEFKANVRHVCFVGEWYRRIRLIYGVSIEDGTAGFPMKNKADDYYYNPNLWQFRNHDGYGITHMLVKKDYKPPRGTLILSNNTYAVYKL